MAAQSAQRAEEAAASVPLIDDTEASPTNPWSGAKTDAELLKKLNANWGAENADKVLGIRDDGSVAPVDASSGIDDTTITTANPWSSAKIVETVCPPFETSGPIVTCNPVEGYPLHVVSQIVPVQEGNGDPSPDNVRPITGWTEAILSVTGRNLFNGSIYGSKNVAGVTIEYDPETQVFTFNGTSSSTISSRAFGLNIPGYNMAFTVSSEILSGGLQGDGYAVAYFGCGDAKKEFKNYIDVKLARSDSKTGICQRKYVTSFWFYITKGITFDNLKVKIQLEVGNQASPYTPYNPASKTITLPFGKTVYGGTVDAVTGEGSDEWAFVEFDGSEDEQYFKNVHSSGRVYFFIDITPYGLVSDPTQATWKCNRLVPCVYNYSSIELPEYSIGFMSLKNRCVIVLENESMLSVDEFKAWLAENPVTVCYKLAEGSAYTVSPLSIPALPGTNTIYTDTGDTTVSGRADPTTILNKLAERIAALESAATNI